MSFDLVARLRLQDDFSRKMQKATRQMDETEKKTNALSSGFKKLGGAVAGLAAAAGLGALSKSVIQTGVDFTSTMSQVAAVTGATDSEMKQLTDQARQLGKDTVHSASAAADGMTYLGMAGFSTSEIMASMPGLLDLATAGALELGDAADIASNILTGFNLEADEMGRVSDVLAKAAASANTDVGQLGRGMSYVAPIAASMGLSLEEVSAGIGMLSDAGIQGERAGTALRGAISQLSSPTTALQKKLSAAGLSAEDVSPRFNSLADIVENLTDAGFTGADALELVGQEAGPGLAAMMTQGSDALRGLTGELENSKGAAQDMAETMSDNLGGDWEKLKSAITENFIAVFMQAEEPLRNIVQGATEFAAKLPEYFEKVKPYLIDFKDTIVEVASYVPLVVDKFKQNWPLIKEAVIGAAVALAAFKVAMSGLSVISTINTLMTAFRAGTLAATLAQYGLNTAILANPFTWIAVAIAGAVAAGVMLYRNWDTVKAKAGELWTKIGEVFGNIKDWMTEKVGQARDSVVGIFTELPERIGERLGYMVGTVVMWLSQLPSKFSEWFTTAKDNAINIIKELPGAIAGFIAEIPGKISGVIGTVWDKFKELGAAIPKAIADGFNAALAGLGKAAKWAIDKVIGGVKGLGNLGKRVATSFGSGYSEATGGKSHYHGIDYVPRDGYQATLHKGEAVITAQENKGRKQGGGTNVSISGNTFHVRQESDIQKVAYELAKLIEQEGAQMA